MTPLPALWTDPRSGPSGVSPWELPGAGEISRWLCLASPLLCVRVLALACTVWCSAHPLGRSFAACVCAPGLTCSANLILACLSTYTSLQALA